jgi:regulation of enolase protein 1 (concanavalin A-like superfamily)
MFRRYFMLLLLINVCLSLAPIFSQTKKSSNLKGWGVVTDPDGDCKFQTKKSKLIITLPGTLHDLNPRNNKINAPLVLQEVEGNFSVQVKISGDFQPGEKSTAPNSPPFNGAGLLLWQDEKNYLRLERNLWFASDGKYTCHPPLFEQCQNGEYTNHNPATTTEPFFKHSTYLRFERRGDKVIAALSHDGKTWPIVKEIIAPYSAQVKVGVDAINTSAKPFTVEFAELKLVKS